MKISISLRARPAIQVFFLVGCAFIWFLIPLVGNLVSLGTVASPGFVAFFAALAIFPSAVPLLIGWVLPSLWGNDLRRRTVGRIVLHTLLAFLCLGMVPWSHVQFAMHRSKLEAIDKKASQDAEASATVEPRILPRRSFGPLPFTGDSSEEAESQRIQRCRDGTLIVLDLDWKYKFIQSAYLRSRNRTSVATPGSLVWFGHHLFRVRESYGDGWYLVELP